MNAEEAREAMKAVLAEALTRKSKGPASIDLTGSWAENGGTSLDAYAAIMRIEEELGFVVPVARLLGPHPLDELIRQAATAPVPVEEPVAPVGAVRATASQRRHWRHAQSEGSAAFLNIGRALHCTQGFDADRAEAAFRALVARHESLRNRFVPTADGLFLEEVTDWPGRAEFARHPVQPDAEAAAVPIRAALGRTFPLAEEPPVRGGCVPLADGTALVYLGVHHIAADGWTVDLLTDDYLALCTGGADGLAPATPYSRYAAALDAAASRGDYADDIAYWQKKFARVSPDFSISRRAGAASGQRAGTSRLLWDGPGEANAVREAARTLGVTTYSLLLSGLLAAAHVLSGEDEVVVMSGVANRNRAEYRTTAGLFTNQIFFVGDFRSTGPLDAYVREVHDDVVESLARSQLPVEVVLDRMGAYDTARTLAPYANILFQAAEAPIDPPAMRDGSWRPHSLGTGSIKRHCNIHLEDDGGEGLALELDYSLAIVGEHTAARLLRALHTATDHIVTHRGGSVADLLLAVKEAAAEQAAPLTVYIADYPGARAEPPLASLVREGLPDAELVELPVPSELDPAGIDQCRRAGHALLTRETGGPAAVVGYCSAATWARHLVATLPGPSDAPAVLSINGNALTEADWFEEFADLVARFDPDADLSEAAPDRIALPREGDLAARCAAARDALAVMRGVMEGAIGRRFGTPLGRVARETLEVQVKWLTYLASCIAVGAGSPLGEERALPDVRLDQSPRVTAWLRAELAPEETVS
ncbi:Linear gramicidin synthase subunit D [Streptomyces sp. ADI96-15]|nr:Linear gramicidin synthase subunit D [Streptomyces sp. ADI96-15]RWZ77143.1 hypothetical protein EQK42_04545 [Streptomyces albidoflavus]